MTISATSSAAGRLRAHQQEFQDHLTLVERVQQDLREDAETLRSQEGWDHATARGVEQWVEDKDGTWRALRRHRYDEEKTVSALLSTLSHRLSRSLHQPIPATSPYSDSSIFYVLPLPEFTSRIDQPIVVITLREVRRDEAGKLDDLKEWSWWALEMVRRVLGDWWQGEVFGNVIPGSKVQGAEASGGKKRKRRGYGGEGCVILVDAEGAGYRNLEVELLPTLLSVGHSHFPGVFDAVYVVNAGWTHRSMWSVVKRILPKSALDKVNFLDTKESLSKIFELGHLPSIYGGTSEWRFSPENNSIFNYYSRHQSYTGLPMETSQFPSVADKVSIPRRTQSSASIADVFYTAQNTPASSRMNSRRNSLQLPRTLSHLRMSNLPQISIEDDKGSRVFKRARPIDHTAAEEKRSEDALEELRSPADQRSPFEDEFDRASGSRQGLRAEPRHPSAPITPHITPLQRIKSLTDFHLYLSPSRLAHLDILSDSEPEDGPIPGDLNRRSISLRRNSGVPVRRALTPAVVDPDRTIRAASTSTLAGSCVRPSLRLHGVAGVKSEETDFARSYSDRLSLHHAQILKQYQAAVRENEAEVLADSLVKVEPDTQATNSTSTTRTDLTVDPEGSSLLTPDTTAPATEVTSPITPAPSQNHSQAVSAFSRSTNPWFGYPAVRSVSPKGHTSIIPRYARNRKRDLAKTLLFLFMLRLQSFRDTAERWLGLHHLGSLPWSRRREREPEATTPSEGLAMMAQKSRQGKMLQRRRGVWDGEWVWMIIGFFLLRGTWVRAVAAPLELLGWEGVRDILGV